MKATASDIRAALLKFYAPPGHRVFFEVSNDTGANARRWIDAVAVGIWPSTGHEVVGIEIKISRGDWKRELAAPAKAQSLMRFCTRWYLACPDGLIAPDELPATWGMLVLREDGTLRQKVQAKLLDPEPLTPGFMMAVLRNVSAVDMELVSRLVAEQVAVREKQIEARIESAVNQRVRDVGARVEKAKEIGDYLKAVTGQSVHEWTFDREAMAAAYLFLKHSQAHKPTRQGFGVHDLPGILSSVDHIKASLQRIFDDPVFAAVRGDLDPTVIARLVDQKGEAA